MDRNESTVRNMLGAIEAPLYDVGVLSDRGMLPGLDGIPASTVLERLPLLKYRNARGSHIYIRPSGEVPQIGRALPFRTAEEPHRRAVPDGRGVPTADRRYVRGTGAGARGTTAAGISFSPKGTEVLSPVPRTGFRMSSTYQDRPAAAEIAFCVAALVDGMTEDRIERTLEGDYLSRDPSPSKRAAYIRRTIEKAKRWAER